VSYSASDAGAAPSGLAEVALYAQAPGDSVYKEVGRQVNPAGSGSFQYTATAGNGAYSFYTVATDVAGNVEAAPSVPDATTTVGACDPLAAPPSNNDPGTLVLADGFETNDFRNWSRVTQQGDATLRIQTSIVHGGRCAALLHVTANAGSLANIGRSLPAGTATVCADGWFDIVQQGTSTSSNVPTFRFFSGGKRILDVSRQNGSGSFFVRYPNGSGGYTVVPTGTKLSERLWYEIKVHVIAAGNQSTVEVWLDGALVYSTAAATLGVSNVDEVLVGSEHPSQEGDLAADDIVLKAS